MDNTLELLMAALAVVLCLPYVIVLLMFVRWFEFEHKKRVQQLNKEFAKDDGFSLLELVVAVGILLVLTVGGVLAYQGITNNARQAAVDKAASEAFTAAQAYRLDSRSDTVAKDVEAEWNGTKKGDSMNLEVLDSPTCLRVTATHERGQSAVRQEGEGCEGAGSENGGNEGEVVPPVVEEPAPTIPAEHQFINASSSSSTMDKVRIGNCLEIVPRGPIVAGATPVYTTSTKSSCSTSEGAYVGPGWYRTQTLAMVLVRDRFSQPIEFDNTKYTVTYSAANGANIRFEPSQSVMNNFKYQGTAGAYAKEHVFVVNNPSELETMSPVFRFQNSSPNLTINFTMEVEGSHLFRGGPKLNMSM